MPLEGTGEWDSSGQMGSADGSAPFAMEQGQPRTLAEGLPGGSALEPQGGEGGTCGLSQGLGLQLSVEEEAGSAPSQPIPSSGALCTKPIFQLRSALLIVSDRQCAKVLHSPASVLALLIAILF